MAKKSRVAIIGRANVGKSTLFNCLTSGPKALVSNRAGTTRDRKENDCTWRGTVFTLIDTGGLDINPQDRIEEKIAEQALAAIRQADCILFVVDVKMGITTADRDIAKLLRSIRKPVILIANKADGKRDIAMASDLYQLGFDKPWPVSSVSGIGTGDMLDEVQRHIKSSAMPEDPGITIAIIGRPNVGKSSLVNALVNEERSIVNDEPYTTRDANNITFTFEGTTMTLVDTAGIRRRSKIDPYSIESESAHLSLKSLKKADVILFVTEADKSLTAQDRQLASLIDESRASVIIIGNKWDLVPDKDEKKSKQFEEYYAKQLNYLVWAPVILMSALEKTKLTKLKKMIMTVYSERFRKIDDNALSKFLKIIIGKHKPVKSRGTRHPYIYRLKQVDVNPPQFVVHLGEKQSLNYTYLNFIEKELRTKFGFTGSPIKIWVEKSVRTKP